jgi:small subunit ribosomal protein S19
MSRSKWKGPFINIKFASLTKKNNVTIVNKNSRIVPEHIGQTVQTHNGKSYSEFIVTKEMLGHIFGEFISTRAKFTFKKKKKK